MLPKGPLMFASFGLALNVVLWSVPGMIVASAVPRLILQDKAPTLAQALASAERLAGNTPSLPDALLQLVGAESEALEVAGMGLRQPTPPDLASRADHAGNRVLEAVAAYVRSAQAMLDHQREVVSTPQQTAPSPAQAPHPAAYPRSSG
jgi:hypothetical protein